VAFDGFGPDVFAWFAGLERDNSKAYFTAHRERYDTEVRGGLEAMLEELRGDFGGEAHVFRQHRDVRFSADKSPYKTRTYGLLHHAHGPAALYAELTARGLYAGTGYHRLERDQLERFRTALADDAAGPRLADAVAAGRDAGLEVVGETLRTAPRGYPRDHPRIELLRHTAVIAGRRLPCDGGITRDAAVAHVAGTWRAGEPIASWLAEHVGPSDLPPRRR
jgi:uncharacterized protein (TIGR02453 family)